MDIIRCNSTMTKFAVNIKKENIFTCFSLKIIEDTSARTFPTQFKSINLNVFDHVANNDVFDKINIPCEEYSLNYEIDLEGFKFTAKLDSIFGVIKTTKSGTPYTEYTLNFIKDIDNQIDPKLSTFLKQKEEDENGKKQIKFFSTVMTEQP